jgi:hypothetical protein
MLGLLSALLEPRAASGFRLDRSNALRISGAVLFGGVLGPVLLLAGLRFTLAGSVSLLLDLELVATAALGVILFREPLGRTGWVGIADVVAAGGLLAGHDGSPGPVAGIANLGIGVFVAPLAAIPGTIGAALFVGAFSDGASIALSPPPPTCPAIAATATSITTRRSPTRIPTGRTSITDTDTRPSGARSHLRSRGSKPQHRDGIPGGARREAPDNRLALLSARASAPRQARKASRASAIRSEVS